jgi:hypothetical protein
VLFWNDWDGQCEFDPRSIRVLRNDIRVVRILANGDIQHYLFNIAVLLTLSSWVMRSSLSSSSSAKPGLEARILCSLMRWMTAAEVLRLPGRVLVGCRPSPQRFPAGWWGSGAPWGDEWRRSTRKWSGSSWSWRLGLVEQVRGLPDNPGRRELHSWLNAVRKNNLSANTNLSKPLNTAHSTFILNTSRIFHPNFFLRWFFDLFIRRFLTRTRRRLYVSFHLGRHPNIMVSLKF